MGDFNPSTGEIADFLLPPACGFYGTQISRNFATEPEDFYNIFWNLQHFFYPSHLTSKKDFVNFCECASCGPEIKHTVKKKSQTERCPWQRWIRLSGVPGQCRVPRIVWIRILYKLTVPDNAQSWKISSIFSLFGQEDARKSYDTVPLRYILCVW